MAEPIEPDYYPVGPGHEFPDSNQIVHMYHKYMGVWLTGFQENWRWYATTDQQSILVQRQEAIIAYRPMFDPPVEQ